MSNTQVTPEVLWAQRSSKDDAAKNYIYLTISVPDVSPKSLKLDLKPTKLTFTGTSDTKKTTYHLDLDFFDEIDVENSKTHHTARDIEVILRKKELKEEYWPRLLKDKAKVHYLKTDFDKWVDEDEQNEAPEDDYMNQFGGMGGGDGGFGGIDFSKLGAGAGGMEGLGQGEEDEEGEESDEEMPELEGEGEASSSKAKIEEVS
ncbi:putative hsp90 associated co-chaperone [Phaeomoniella chlamydospora]|uniref:Putative hsp90 associated co-chaperone n=1 Tax=Phaeomoniella chlamydospora TaxID=158046 RepID=A0A0G2DVH6_PHACM|nr:putative hsp90 associated co-chaperone [Phaeomoniella chlamydospora]